jgi:saccharopepsin
MKRIVLLVLGIYSYITIPLKQVLRPDSNSLRKSVSLDLDYLISSPVENSYNLQYNAVFQVGTPPQDMELVLDTGSSWIWVPSVDCDCHESNRYDYKSSSTYYDTKKSLILQYGVGTVYGNLSQETFSIGNLSAKNQDFILSYKDSDLDTLSSDGLLGLGFNSLSNYKPTFIENLKSQGQISSSIFSLYLNNHDNPWLDSALTIGDYNPSLYGRGDKIVVKIYKNYGYWLSIIQNLYINSSVYKQNAYGILDIGTSLIMGPSTEIKSIKKDIIDKLSKPCYDLDLLVCICTLNQYHEYPGITFSIDGHNLTVSPENYLYYDQGYCYVLIASTDSYYWIIGQPFFREYYSVYNMEKPEVYLYQAAKEGNQKTKSYNYVYHSYAIGAAVSVLSIAYYVHRRTNQDPFRYNSLY